jgi:DNA-binding transcriptional LysR family regulator
MDAELSHLRHFFEVARQGGFTRAAEVLRAQQPGMSRSVRILEERLGVTLIDRRGKHFALTGAGERVMAACARIFTDVENISRIAEEERGALTGPLRIGAGGIIASRVIPDALEQLLADHPRVWPMVFTSPVTTGVARIATGELELGIYHYVTDVPSSVVSEELVRTPYRLVVRADRAKDMQTLTSFIGSREVEDPRTSKFPTLDRLRRTYPKAEIRISTNDTEAHLRMVKAGLGVSILPELLVADDLKAKRLVDVFRGETFVFPVLLVTRRSHVLTASAQALLALVRARLTPAKR